MSNYIRFMANDRISKIIGITLLAFVLLNFPIISLFGKDIFIFGIPLLYFYIFFVWISFIIVTAILLGRKDKE